MAERLRMEEEACKSKAEEEEERRQMHLEKEEEEKWENENDVVVSLRVNAQEAARLEVALKMALGALKVQIERMQALLRLLSRLY